MNSLNYNGLKLDKVEVESAVIGMDGYSWFSNNRNNIHIRAKKGSGGIGFLVKKYILEQYSVQIEDDTIEGIL